MENALKHLDLSNKRVLDLGCGSGGITRKMKELNPSAKIFGVDFNPDAISYAKNTDSGTKGLNYKVGDAERIQFRNNFFDIVIGLDVLDHVPDYKKCLNEIYRVLNKEGELILTVENNYSLWPLVEMLWDKIGGGGRDLMHVHVVRFNPKSFRQIMLKKGFEIREYYTIHNLNTFFYLISSYYPKFLNGLVSRKKMGLTLFCYARKAPGELESQ